MTKDYFSIYRDENDEFQRQSVHMRSKNKTRGNSYAPTLVLLLFVVGLGGVVVSSLFSRSSVMTSSEPLSVVIDAEKHAISGQSFRIVVRIKNENTEPMSSLSLFAEYPKGFRYERSDRESENVQHTFWKLKPLDRMSDYSFVIEGTLEGDEKTQHTFQFKLNFGYVSSRAEFVIKRDHTVELNQSNITMEVKGPELVRPEEQLEYVITYGDLAALPPTDGIVELRVRIPDSFTLHSFEPSPDLNGSWSANLLKQNLDPLKRFGVIKLKGAYKADSMGDAQIGTELGFMKGNDFVNIQRASFTTSVASNDLQIGIMINGSSDLSPRSSGMPLELTIQYKNSSAIPLEDVKVRLQGEGAALDWTKLENPSFARYENGSLAWSKKEAEQFSRIEPGASGELKARIGTLSAEEFSATSGDKKKDTIVFTIESKVTQKKSSESLTIDQKPMIVEVPLNSDVRINATMHSGDILNQNTPTHDEHYYTVEWIIENTFHELTSLEVTAPLGSDSFWVNTLSRSAGDISFDKKSSSVHWTLNRLPTDIRSVRASFVVLIKKSEKKDENIIIREGTFDAIDKVTAGKIHISLKELHGPTD